MGDVVAPTLSKTIIQRLRLCSATTLDVLSLASVLGAEFTADDLSAIQGEPVSEFAAVREGLEASVIEDRGDHLAFRHDLIREALYAELPLTVRNSLHLEVARRLSAAGAVVALTAPHLLRGVTRPEADLLDLLQRSAVEAVRPAPETAVALLDRVVELAGPASARGEATLGDRALALLQLGRFEDAEAACRAALAKNVSPSTDVNLRLRLVGLLSSRGDPSAALPEIEAALADDSLTLAERVPFEATAAVVHMFAANFTGAMTIAEEAVAHAEASDDNTATVVALNALAFTRRAAGRSEEALLVSERAAALTELEPTYDALRAVPHVMRGQALLDAGRVTEAIESCRRGLELAEAAADPDVLAWHHASLGHCLVLLGDYDAAETEFDITANSTAAQSVSGRR